MYHDNKYFIFRILNLYIYIYILFEIFTQLYYIMESLVSENVHCKFILYNTSRF